MPTRLDHHFFWLTLGFVLLVAGLLGHNLAVQLAWLVGNISGAVCVMLMAWSSDG